MFMFQPSDRWINRHISRLILVSIDRLRLYFAYLRIAYVCPSPSNCNHVQMILAPVHVHRIASGAPPSKHTSTTINPCDCVDASHAVFDARALQLIRISPAFGAWGQPRPLRRKCTVRLAGYIYTHRINPMESMLFGRSKWILVYDLTLNYVIGC